MSFLVNARVLIDQVKKGWCSDLSFDPAAVPAELLSHLTPTEYAESIQRLNAAANAHPAFALAIHRLAKVVNTLSFLVLLNWLFGWTNAFNLNNDGAAYCAFWTYVFSLALRFAVGSHLLTERRRRLAHAAADEHGKYMNRFPQLSWRVSHLHYRRATLEVDKMYPVMPHAHIAAAGAAAPAAAVPIAAPHEIAHAAYVPVHIAPAPSAPAHARSINNSDVAPGIAAAAAVSSSQQSSYYPVMPSAAYRV